LKKSTKVFKKKEKKIHPRQVTRWSASVALVTLDIDTKRRVLADMLGQCHQMKICPRSGPELRAALYGPRLSMHISWKTDRLGLGQVQLTVGITANYLSHMAYIN
jgi:hypothetical protein